MLKEIKKILIIKLRDIGDIVLSTPVINVLYENTNSPEIIYVLKKEYEYFKYLLPNVKEVIPYDKKDPFDFLRVIKKLRKYKFDLAVNLHATYRSALMTYLSGAKFRLVHNHSGKDYFTSIPLGIEEKRKNIIERDLDTLNPLKIDIHETLKQPLLKINEEYAKYILDEEMINTIGLGIGAKRPAKMWDKEKFAKLAKELISRGYNISIFCSAKEKHIADYIRLSVSDDIKIFAGFDIFRVAFFINKLRLFIGNDSGLRHIAAALNIKTITLFGPEDPEEWHPYDENNHPFIFHNVECVNCGKYICPYSHHKCMNEITVDEVLSKVEKLMGKKDIIENNL